MDVLCFVTSSPYLINFDSLAIYSLYHLHSLIGQTGNVNCEWIPRSQLSYEENLVDAVVKEMTAPTNTSSTSAQSSTVPTVLESVTASTRQEVVATHTHEPPPTTDASNTSIRQEDVDVATHDQASTVPALETATTTATSDSASTRQEDVATHTHEPPPTTDASNTSIRQEDAATRDQSSTVPDLETATTTDTSDSTSACQEDVASDGFQYMLAEIYLPGQRRKMCCHDCGNAAVCSWRNTTDDSIHPSCEICMR